VDKVVAVGTVVQDGVTVVTVGSKLESGALSIFN